MARTRTFGFYVIKAVRLTGWLLLGVMVLYISSGYALRPEFGFDRVMSTRTAEVLHLSRYLDRLLVPCFLVHTCGSIYLAMKRWGWIKRRPRS